VQQIDQIRRRLGVAALSSTLALCLGAGGCSLVPDYQRPAIDTAPAWNISPRGVGPRVAAELEWWRRFGSPELDRLMNLGLAGNFNLQAASARIAEAEGIAEVDGAPLWPSLNLVGTQDQSSGVKSSRTHQVLGQATYELDFWGKNRAAAASGTALADASVLDADTVAITLSASVADTYFQILSLRERVQFAQQIAGDARHVLNLIEVRQANGAATDLQVQQQRTAVATFDAVVPALQQQMDVATHALAVLTGRAPEGFGVGASDLDDLSLPEVRPDLPAPLLQRRPDIRAAEARLISANFDIGVARAAFFPSIALTTAAGVGSRSLSHFFPPATITDLGAGLLQPLFQGGQLEGQLKVSRARQIEMLATYRQTVIAAFQDVEDALSTLEHVRTQAAIETTAEVAAHKAADLAQLQYSLGSADYLTVLSTEQTLFQTRDTLLQLQLQRLQAIVGLFRALGGGFDAGADLPIPQTKPSGDRS